MVFPQHLLFMHNGKHAPFASVVCLHWKQRPKFDGRGLGHAALPRTIGGRLNWKQPLRKTTPARSGRTQTAWHPP